MSEATFNITYNTPRPPKFVYSDWAKVNLPKGTPTTNEIKYFIEREKERWLYGDGILNGLHYYYLTQGVIKVGRGEEIRPLWRDVDEVLSEAYLEAKKKENDLMFTKRREIGGTVFFGGAVPSWNSMIYPGSTSILTSADSKRLSTMFTEKTRVFYDNLSPYFKPEELSHKSGSYIQYGKKVGNTINGLKSIIAAVPTSKDKKASSNLETYRAMYIFLDEFYLHNHATEVLDSAQACLRDNFTKLGPMVLGGSCGITSQDGARKGQELYRAAADGTMDITSIFLPGWMGIMAATQYDIYGKKMEDKNGKLIHQNFCVNGYSDQEAATDWILKRREIYEDAIAKDPSNSKIKNTYSRFVKEYPLTIEEVFDLTNQGTFPDDIQPKINQRERILINEPPPIGLYDLQRTPNGIKAIPDKHGWIKILNHPKPNIEYIAATDPIPFSNKELDSGSDNCFGIKDRENDVYEAIYKERNLNPDTVVMRQLIAQEYFNFAKNMIETNRGEVMYKVYCDMGRRDMLEFRPAHIGIKEWAKGHKGIKGIHLNDKTHPIANKHLFDYFRNYVENIYFIEMLQETKNFLVENTDILSMMKIMEMYDANLTAKVKLQYDTQVYTTQHREPYIDEHGRMQTRWVTVKSTDQITYNLM